MMYRAATMDDAAMLMRWRNDPLTIANNRKSSPVTETGHEAWLRKALRGDRMVFICFEDDHNPPVGTVQLEKMEHKENGYETSVTVAPEARGHGYGGKILKLVCGDFPESTFYAEIKFDNKASMKSFGVAGFVQIGSYGLWTQWRRLPLR
jgi:RimJ/RimL family protein N-acetyltransferase